MKTEFYVEYDEKQVVLQDIEERAKATWKEEGNKMKELKSLQLYFKPQEQKVYYVFNGDSNGDFFGV
ncbi:MAG: DUF6465 family protein [Clostridiales bacterium]|jgi:hypothetical protein|nr:DUF6465 family protein [Clostridiales bacterium]